MSKTKDSILIPMKTIAVESKNWIDYVMGLNECAYSDTMVEKIIIAAAKLAKTTKNEDIIKENLGMKKKYLLIASDTCGIDITEYKTKTAAQKAMKAAWQMTNEPNVDPEDIWYCGNRACAYDGNGYSYWEIKEV